MRLHQRGLVPLPAVSTNHKSTSMEGVPDFPALGRFFDPSLRRIALHFVATLRHQEPQHPVDNLTDECSMLLETQCAKSPDSIFFGFLSPMWMTLQNQYLKAIGQQRDKQQASSTVKLFL
jgi:hypothetical protein